MSKVRLIRLFDKHRSLEDRLRAEARRPCPDSLVLQALKRRKLNLKDQIRSAEGAGALAAD